MCDVSIPTTVCCFYSFFLAEYALASPLLPKNIPRVKILCSWPGHSKTHSHETNSMMGITDLVSSIQQTQVLSGKPKLYWLSFPLVIATVYLNTECNLEFVAKYKASPLHHCVSHFRSSELCLATAMLCKGRLPAHTIAGSAASSFGPHIY